jgi:hypothetical protein
VAIEVVFETHSITEDNEQGRATGWLPGRLSPRGRELARELGLRRRDVECRRCAGARGGGQVGIQWRRRFAGRRLAGLDDDAPIGQPQAELVLSGAEREQLMRAGAGEDRPVPGTAGQDRAGLRGRRDEQAGRRRPGGG